MLRGSWETCQQMGLPGCLTKPTNLPKPIRMQGQSPFFLREIPSEATGATEEFIGGWERGGQQGQARGGSARISPWELSQPRRAGLLWHSPAVTGPPCPPGCWCAELSPLRKEPLRGAGKGGRPPVAL